MVFISMLSFKRYYVQNFAEWGQLETQSFKTGGWVGESVLLGLCRLCYFRVVQDPTVRKARVSFNKYACWYIIPLDLHQWNITVFRIYTAEVIFKFPPFLCYVDLIPHSNPPVRSLLLQTKVLEGFWLCNQMPSGLLVTQPKALWSFNQSQALLQNKDGGYDWLFETFCYNFNGIYRAILGNILGKNKIHHLGYQFWLS